MKTILVVEDEKLIRQGIVAMIKRSGVPVEEVLECANGVQALELLKERPVDVMLTDIRMPKMTGTELVKEIQKLPEPPLAVAVSGYDDFSYAVEMMRNGVREYILKPVEREKLKSVLLRLDEELSERAETKRDTEDVGKRLLKYLLLDTDAPADELRALEAVLKNEIGGVLSVAVTWPGAAEASADVSAVETPADGAAAGMAEAAGGAAAPLSAKLVLPDVDGADVYLLAESDPAEVSLPPHTGFCTVSEGVEGLKNAYEIARRCRENAYFTGAALVSALPRPVPAELLLSARKYTESTAIERRVQLSGTARAEETRKEWQGFFTAASRGQIPAEDFSDAMRRFFEEYRALYHVVPEVSLLKPFSFPSLADYREAFKVFLTDETKRRSSETDPDGTEAKLQSAIRYIREHFAEDLNMAVVSNEVSMNYSLFSSAFKAYTGTNFVAYLKALRMAEAKKLLSETEKKVGEIAADCGYDNEKHFMKSFKAYTGVSPSEYRKNENKRELPA